MQKCVVSLFLRLKLPRCYCCLKNYSCVYWCNLLFVNSLKTMFQTFFPIGYRDFVGLLDFFFAQHTVTRAVCRCGILSCGAWGDCTRCDACMPMNRYRKIKPRSSALVAIVIDARFPMGSINYRDECMCQVERIGGGTPLVINHVETFSCFS